MAGNGRSGRKPKPTDLKLLQGTFQASRHGHEAQPVAKGFPEPPWPLSEREQGLWLALKRHCEPWSAHSDGFAFAGVVTLLDRILRVHEAMQGSEGAAKPLAYKFSHDADGNQNVEPKENPLYGLELKVWRELRAYIGLTGLSPVDRARVHGRARDQEPVNPLDRFIKKANG